MGQFKFYLLVPRHTPAYSLIANAMLMCRFAPPLAFNFMAALAMPPSDHHTFKARPRVAPSSWRHGIMCTPFVRGGPSQLTYALRDAAWHLTCLHDAQNSLCRHPTHTAVLVRLQCEPVSQATIRHTR